MGDVMLQPCQTGQLLLRQNERAAVAALGGGVTQEIDLGLQERLTGRDLLCQFGPDARIRLTGLRPVSIGRPICRIRRDNSSIAPIIDDGSLSFR